MNDIKKLDLLIVYSEENTISAATKDSLALAPFPKKSKNSVCNFAYAYFLEQCKRNNIEAAFTTTKDIDKNGFFSSYWVFNKTWKKINKPCKASVIFDKFFPMNEELKSKRINVFSNPNVRQFTDKHLLEIFYDKYQTYLELTDFSIPTVKIKNKEEISIDNSLKRLHKIIKLHNNKDDFTSILILKDRHGADGTNIYKIESDFANKISVIMNRNKNISFILQPFVDFGKGYRYKNFSGQTEIRMIFLGREIVQTYIRVKGNKDFLRRYGVGGAWIFKNKIPKKVKDFSDKIILKLNKKNAFFTLDFIMSDRGNVYLLEANTSPGIWWQNNFPEHIKMKKAMIDIIVDELLRQVVLINRKIASEKALVLGENSNYLLS